MKDDEEKVLKCLSDIETKGNADSVRYIRVSIKYLLMDLEASRREIKALKKMLQKDGGQHGRMD